MPPLETADRHQPAILWPWIGKDKLGQDLVGEPVEVLVRWTWGNSRAVDPQGNLIAVDAQVVADREVAVGSIMLESSLADWLGTGSDEGQEPWYMEVKTYRTATDIGHRYRRCRLGLVRFRGSLPMAAT